MRRRRGPLTRSGVRRLPRAAWGVALVLTVAAAGPRLVGLGDAGLTGDEDYTYLTANAVARGEPSAMPSGMPYLRALPLTWLNAGAVRVLGPDDARAYRLTAAVAGTLTPGVLYLGSASMGLPHVGAVAGTLLAFSEWHVATSRRGRMYAPFVLAFLVCGFLFWRWIETGRAVVLVAALVTYALTLSLHLLGLIAPQFALFALALPGQAAVSVGVGLSVVAVVVGLGYYLQQSLVQWPYGVWSLPRDYTFDGVELQIAEMSQGGGWTPLLVLAGGAVGLWLAVGLVRRESSTERPVVSNAVVLASGAAIGVFLFNGHLWGAALAAGTLFVVRPVDLRGLLRIERAPLAVMAVGATGWVAYALSTREVRTGLRRLFGYPYPYPVVLWDLSPAMVVMAAIAVAWVAFGRDSERRRAVRVACLAVIGPLALIGLARPWGPPRYLSMTYPFVLVLAGWFVYEIVERAAARRTPSGSSAVVLPAVLLAVAAGVFPGHGVPYVWPRPGDPMLTDVELVDWRTMPRVDHATPGRALAAMWRPGDVVVAEGRDHGAGICRASGLLVPPPRRRGRVPLSRRGWRRAGQVRRQRPAVFDAGTAAARTRDDRTRLVSHLGRAPRPGFRLLLPRTVRMATGTASPGAARDHRPGRRHRPVLPRLSGVVASGSPPTRRELAALVRPEPLSGAPVRGTRRPRDRARTRCAARPACLRGPGAGRGLPPPPLGVSAVAGCSGRGAAPPTDPGRGRRRAHDPFPRDAGHLDGPQHRAPRRVPTG